MTGKSEEENSKSQRKHQEPNNKNQITRTKKIQKSNPKRNAIINHKPKITNQKIGSRKSEKIQ
jgi:hypothetical protein